MKKLVSFVYFAFFILMIAEKNTRPGIFAISTAGTIPEFVVDEEFPQMHICRDGGEVYSASYLTTKEHLLWEEFEKLNFCGRLTCERASFMMMRSKANPLWNIPGTPVQTLDLLDLSVIHLSAYERLQRKYLKIPHKWNTGAKVIPILEKLKLTDKMLQSSLYTNRYLSQLQVQAPELQRTLAVMPILIDSMGLGHSATQNRIPYLKTCFWSLYKIIPNIVVSVASREEKIYLETQVKLPFYEILVLDYINRTDALPAATVIETQRRFRSGLWDFDYLYYTESDQILMIRSPEKIFSYLKKYPQRVVLPHRLMPYPVPLIRDAFQKKVDFHTSGYAWMNMSCCMEHTNCLGDRTSWISIRDPTVSVIKILNFAIPLGNSNFIKQTFRACKLIDGRRVDQC